ncbi:MAG TPA: hypothetical protein VGR26_04880 [Acidimicrobiales bacterium]|nr:hypothetical protein [Acidimicrobiales bacterium]
MTQVSHPPGLGDFGHGVDVAPDEVTPVPPQQRLESREGGRWLVSGFLVVTLAALLVWNLPASELRSLGLPFAEPYINATGLTQTWNLFAPDPLRHSRELVAHVHYDDGRSVSWRPPQGGPWLAQYRTYRWYAQVARLRLDRSRPRWEPFAAWVARIHEAPGRKPVRVELVRRWRELAPPGGGPGGAWEESTFYVLDLAADPKP